MIAEPYRQLMRQKQSEIEAAKYERKKAERARLDRQKERFDALTPQEQQRVIDPWDRFIQECQRHVPTIGRSPFSKSSPGDFGDFANAINQTPDPEATLADFVNWYTAQPGISGRVQLYAVCDDIFEAYMRYSAADAPAPAVAVGAEAAASVS
jgi:hypothetical protein